MVKIKLDDMLDLDELDETKQLKQFEQLAEAHRQNEMFYVGELKTGHIVYAKIEKTNFFETFKDYSSIFKASQNAIENYCSRSIQEIGYVPERNIAPEDNPIVKYKTFFRNPLMKVITEGCEDSLVLVFDTEFKNIYKVYDPSKEKLLYRTRNEEEVIEYLVENDTKKIKDKPYERTFELMTSFAMSLYLQGYFITFNVIRPLEFLTEDTTYDQLPQVDMEEWLAFVLDELQINYGAFVKKNKNRFNQKSRKLDITLLAHNGRAEWNKFKWFNTITFDEDGKLKTTIDEKENVLRNYVYNIQGGDLTITPPMALINRKNKLHFVSINIRDTMALVDKEHSSLKAIGKIVELVSKVHIEKHDIQNMDTYLINNPKEYIEYAIEDTIVPLVYCGVMFGINALPPITLLTLAQKVVVKQLERIYREEAKYYTNYVIKDAIKRGVEDSKGELFSPKIEDTYELSTDTFNMVYRHLVPLNEKQQNCSGFDLYDRDGKTTYLKEENSILPIARNAYKGGENFCNSVIGNTHYKPTDQYVEVIKNKGSFTEFKEYKNVSASTNTPSTAEMEALKKLCTELTLTYDLDIPSAYPLAIYPIVALDTVRPIAYENNMIKTFTPENTRSEMQKIMDEVVAEINREQKMYGTVHKPLTEFDLGIPGFVVVEECITPEKYRPILSAKLPKENIPVNPTHLEPTTNQIQTTYTFLEFVQALSLGCTITISKMVIGRPVFDDQGELLRPLGRAIVEIVKLRKDLVEEYKDKKCLPALVCKLIANGAYYGKTAQNCITRKTYNALDEETEDRGPSRLTQPVYASYITAGVRCILNSANKALVDNGYGQIDTQTTDGFISRAPEFVINNIMSGSIVEFFKNVRRELSAQTENEVDDRLLVVKHMQEVLFNFTTRGNVGFNYSKTLQVPVGYKNGVDDEDGYVYETYYVDHLLTDQEKTELKNKGLKDRITDGVCAMQGFKSEYGFDKNSEEYKCEIVDSYLKGNVRVQPNSYKPEALTYYQKTTENEWPMSVVQISKMKLNFDFKSVLQPEKTMTIMVNGQPMSVGLARPPKSFEEANMYRDALKNRKNCIRQNKELKRLENSVSKMDNRLSTFEMKCFLTAYANGLVDEKIPVMDKLKGQKKLFYINRFVNDGQLELREMQNALLPNRSEKNIKYYMDNEDDFVMMIKAMKKVKVNK